MSFRATDLVQAHILLLLLRVRTLDLQGRQFNFRSFHFHVTTLGMFFTRASVTKQYNLVLAKGGDALELGR